MSTPTDTAEFLEELNGGAFASQIGHALSEVAAGVVDHGKAGKLVITLDLSQIGEGQMVKIKHKLDCHADMTIINSTQTGARPTYLRRRLAAGSSPDKFPPAPRPVPGRRRTLAINRALHIP